MIPSTAYPQTSSSSSKRRRMVRYLPWMSWSPELKIISPALCTASLPTQNDTSPSTSTTIQGSWQVGLMHERQSTPHLRQWRQQMVGNGTPRRGLAGQWIPKRASQEDSLRSAQSQKQPWHRATILNTCTKTVSFAVHLWPQWEIAEDLCSFGSKGGLPVPGNTEEVCGAGQIQIRIQSVCMRSTWCECFHILKLNPLMLCHMVSKFKQAKEWVEIDVGVGRLYKNKNIKNVTRCRDSRSAKSIETR